MSDTKISALTSATTPLAGTEVLPIVQSATTTKVSVEDITAGRAVNALSLTATAGAIRTAGAYPLTLGYDQGGGATISYNVSGNLHITPLSGYDTKLTAGNLLFGTAAKGINFTANTPASGMTSQLLNWYEEGTWTPAQGAGLTVVGAFSSSGTYTRVGRLVTVNGSVSGATSVAVSASGVITNNLPFNSAITACGSAANAAISASSVVVVTTASITAAAAISATTTINFSVTYTV